MYLLHVISLERLKSLAGHVSCEMSTTFVLLSNREHLDGFPLANGMALSSHDGANVRVSSDSHSGIKQLNGGYFP